MPTSMFFAKLVISIVMTDGGFVLTSAMAKFQLSADNTDFQLS